MDSTAGIRDTTLRIGGMTCASCVARVEKALQAVIEAYTQLKSRPAFA